MRILSIPAIVGLILLTSCGKYLLGDDINDTPQNNFNYTWNIIQNRYSFFPFDKINWDSVYLVYSQRVNPSISEKELFNVLEHMLNVLKDGHVNLTSSQFGISQYIAPDMINYSNINISLLKQYYLGTNYLSVGPLEYQKLENNSIGYIRYNSFLNTISSQNMDLLIQSLSQTDGIIFDVRGNGGGDILNIFPLVAHFADSTRFVYSSIMKNGPSYDAFTAPDNIFMGPSPIHYTKPVCVLTDKNSFSSTSYFVLAMHAFPNVCIIGDTTGGGLGAPSGAELPNGWGLRFPVSYTLSPSGINFENGEPPDITCLLDSNYLNNGIDNVIQKAENYIKQKIEK